MGQNTCTNSIPENDTSYTLLCTTFAETKEVTQTRKPGHVTCRRKLILTNPARILTQILARILAQIPARILARTLAQILAWILARTLAQILARILARLLARILVRILARILARILTRRIGILKISAHFSTTNKLCGFQIWAMYVSLKKRHLSANSSNLDQFSAISITPRPHSNSLRTNALLGSEVSRLICS